ncbi:trehalose-6-phosphate synthase [Candidatus Curtissbacteria bacterium]|nr:trehalose-6-phosphate synthase [Candidatus Curtissbacteria bacterium]
MKPFMESGDFKDAKWIGWPGNGERGGLEEAMRGATESEVYNVDVVTPTPENFKKWYEGYANQVLWPLFHGRPDLIRQDLAQEDWDGYLEVNKEYAEALVKHNGGVKPSDFIFIQDYHLMAAATYLREMGVQQPIAHFLHIPFPQPEALAALPQKEELLGHLLNYDLLGFQTDKYRDTFVANIEAYVPEAEIQKEEDGVVINYNGRKIRANTFPISIDAQSWENEIQDPNAQKVRDRLKRYAEATKSEDVKEGVKLIFSLARADYSKGLDLEQKFLAKLLEKYPEHQGQIKLLQIAQASRENIEAYKEFKKGLKNGAKAINEQFGIPAVMYLPERETSEWVRDENGELARDEKGELVRSPEWVRDEKGKLISAPDWKRDAEGNLLRFPHEYKKKVIHQFNRGMKITRLVGHYQAADVMSVPTQADGMNLVAKEYAVTGSEEGVMLLGQGAGAAVELGEYALLIDPKDIEGSADRLHEALTMSPEEKRRRKEGMYQQVTENDINVWKDRQVGVWHKIWEEKRQTSLQQAA